MKKILWLIISITPLMVFIVPLSGCSNPLIPPHVDIGTSKADVIDHLGDTEETRIIHKQMEYIWGPEEAWGICWRWETRSKSGSTNTLKGPINYTS